ncbi:hypothetical protein [Prosthecobacter sp.]|uniref:hypothetical protein n=1 Tax=Prosthecobacter sp. TaxID=1965333 RepID=UPI0037832D09
MHLIFEPYHGALPLKFGLTTPEASQILGIPRHRQATSYGPEGQEWVYDQFNLAFDTEDKLYQIGFDKSFSGELLFRGIEIMKGADALRRLADIDGEPFIWVGFIMLMNLGLRLGGYHESADEGRTVSLFKRGRYDAKIPRFKPFKT